MGSWAGPQIQWPLFLLLLPLFQTNTRASGNSQEALDPDSRGTGWVPGHNSGDEGYLSNAPGPEAS